MDSDLGIFKPWEETTIDGFIAKGKVLSLSHERFQFKTTLDDGTIIPFRSIVNKYHGCFTRFVRPYTFTDDEYRYYIYNPKLYCAENYGTPELWSELLFINHMVSVVEFKKKTIKVFSTAIVEYISELMMLYKDDLIDNWSEIGEVYT